MSELSARIDLMPIGTVTRSDALFRSETPRPWLGLRFHRNLPAGRWVTLSYRTSFFDSLVRPLIRFEASAQPRQVPMPAGLFGMGSWTGWIPPDTTAVRISPVERAGLFGFALDSCTIRSHLPLVVQGVARKPSEAAVMLSSWIGGSRDESRDHLEKILGSHPLKQYHDWRARRLRNLDLADLDAPRHDWSTGVHIRFVCAASAQDRRAVAVTIQSLREQPYWNWSLALISDSSVADAQEFQHELRQGQVVEFAPASPAIDLRHNLGQRVLLAPLIPGSRIASYVPAVLAEHVAAFPHHMFLYGDEDQVDRQGRYHSAKLKPDWSPIFEECGDYIGSAVYIREAVVAAIHGVTAADLASPRAVSRLFKQAGRGAVGHIRRVTVTLGDRRNRRSVESVCTLPDPRPPAVTLSDTRPQATIIILNKDRPDLLSACLSGVWQTRPSNFEVLLVERGSRDPRTWQIYRSAAADPRFRLIHSPGPFNFAHICNDAAKHAQSPILVFLNNDTELPDASWLERLLPFVTRETVGAVGAKLFYPSGRLQHGGLIVGLGGFAAHIDSGAPGHISGYLRWHDHVHEVSAVTGACLAVDKAKFEAVGGFDAVHFPVELNDVDLCLRLTAAGWASVFVADCHLIHHESATRGRTRNPAKTYAQERAAFRNRWPDAIRDDPCFHPSLSLSSVFTALG